jgi:hypothetical protein
MNCLTWQVPSWYRGRPHDVTMSRSELRQVIDRRSRDDGFALIRLSESTLYRGRNTLSFEHSPVCKCSGAWAPLMEKLALALDTVSIPRGNRLWIYVLGRGLKTLLVVHELGGFYIPWVNSFATLQSRRQHFAFWSDRPQ